MDEQPYTTVEYREELNRVRRARRRNTAIIIIADIGIVVGAAYLVFTHFAL